MKKAKQIFAIVLCVILVALYLITLIAAITDNSGTMNYFFASVVATILVPALIWAYTLIYKLIKKNHQNELDNEDK